MFSAISMGVPPLLAVVAHVFVQRRQRSALHLLVLYIGYLSFANASILLFTYLRDGVVYSLFMRSFNLMLQYLGINLLVCAGLVAVGVWLRRFVQFGRPRFAAAETETRLPGWRVALGGTLLFFAFLLALGTGWAFANFGTLTPDKLLFQIFQPLAGTGEGFIGRFVLQCIVPAAVLAIGLSVFILWRRQRRLAVPVVTKHSSRPIYPAAAARRSFVTVCAIVLLSSMCFSVMRLGLPGYLVSARTENSFIGQHYADPEKVALRFPTQKRNLVYIFMESMEVTYAAPDMGGTQPHDVTPELSQLRRENVSFSGTGGSGALPTTNTGWTVAGMVAQHTGVPLKVPVQDNAYGSADTPYLPGVFSLGDVLAREGYNQMLMVGSDIDFGGRRYFFEQHGGYDIFDYYTAVERGLIPDDYYEWWGFEDQKLYGFAQTEITRLAGLGVPFNFTMLTVDTHHVEGYACPQCGTEHTQQYANVLSCASRQVYAFVRWLQAQPFYKDTTIVIAGDHLSMNTSFFEALDPGYQRTTANVYINAAATPAQAENRQFATVDLYPTTLAALGVAIEGERLGLGTNLFSGAPTLIEEHSYDTVDNAFAAHSEFFNTQLL